VLNRLTGRNTENYCNPKTHKQLLMKRAFNKLFLPKDVDDDNRYLGNEMKFYSLDRFADTEKKLCKILSQIFKFCQTNNHEGISKLCQEYVDVMLRRSVGTKDYLSKMEKIYEKTDATGGNCGAICDSFKFVYSCEDCSRGSSAILCPNCFAESNHQGHKAHRQTNIGGFCDCGDSALWDPRGYCSQHTGKSKNDSCWPEGKRLEFQNHLIRGLFPIIQIWDRNEVIPVNFVSITGLLFNDFIVPALTEMWDISDPFAVKNVICSSLLAPITTVARDCKPMLFHHHNDLLASKSGGLVRQECNCSLLALIMRFSINLNQDDPDPINTFIWDLCAVPEFKTSLAVEYFRHLRFFYKIGPGQEVVESSDLLNSESLVLGSKSIHRVLFTHCDILGHLECLKSIVINGLTVVKASAKESFYKKVFLPFIYLISCFLPHNKAEAAGINTDLITESRKGNPNSSLLKLGISSLFTDILAMFDEHCEDMIDATSSLDDKDGFEVIANQMSSDLITCQALRKIGAEIIRAIMWIPAGERSNILLSFLSATTNHLIASKSFTADRKVQTNFIMVLEEFFVELVLAFCCLQDAGEIIRAKQFCLESYLPLRAVLFPGEDGLLREKIIWERISFSCARGLGLIREMQRGLWVSSFVLT
jgi:Putative zinc finger in N-recognin (UBR box)